MAFRALITIQSLDLAGVVQNECHATMRLGDEWNEAEKVAHCLMSERTYPGATWLACGGLEELTWRGCDWAGVADYRKTYADQEWVLTFKCLPNESDIEATLTGKDGVGEMIFFRRRVCSV